MFGAECELLVLVPRLDTRDGVIRIRLRSWVFICQPMHSRQKLHAVRSLKAFDQGRKPPEGSSQFLDFKQRHAVPGKRVMINQADQRRPPRGHPGTAGRDRHLIGGRRTFGLVQKDGYVRERCESTFNARTDLIPIQAAVAATERRHGNRLDLLVLHSFDEGLETGFNIRHARAVPPIAFGRKIDDPPRMGEAMENKHVAWLDLAMLAGSDVGIIVVGECLTKMQRDTFSHDADSIDGIDQSVGARVENVAGDVLDHNVSNTNFSEP